MPFFDDDYIQDVSRIENNSTFEDIAAADMSVSVVEPATKEVTIEEFEGEEKKIHRSHEFEKNLHSLFREAEKETGEEKIFYESIVENKSRRVAALSLFEILALKTAGKIDIEQAHPYDDIAIVPTSTF